MILVETDILHLDQLTYKYSVFPPSGSDTLDYYPQEGNDVLQIIT